MILRNLSYTEPSISLFVKTSRLTLSLFPCQLLGHLKMYYLPSTVSVFWTPPGRPFEASLGRRNGIPSSLTYLGSSYIMIPSLRGLLREEQYFKAEVTFCEPPSPEVLPPHHLPPAPQVQARGRMTAVKLREQVCAATEEFSSGRYQEPKSGLYFERDPKANRPGCQG